MAATEAALNPAILALVQRAYVQGERPETLAHWLTEREETMADHLRERGTQLGTFPQFVAEALAEVGMGKAITPEHREYLRQQYLALKQHLEADHGLQFGE